MVEVIGVALPNATAIHSKVSMVKYGPYPLHIVVMDITNWTRLCYEAKQANRFDAIAEGFRIFVAEAYQAELQVRVNPCRRPDKFPLARESEDSELVDPTVDIANHTGDGFILLCSNAEMTLDFARKLRDNAFRALVDCLKASHICSADDVELRLAIHSGDVWTILSSESQAAEEQFAMGDFYFSEAINLASRLVTSDFCRAASTRAICTEEFRQCLPEKYGPLFGQPHELRGRKDGDEERDIDYPTNVHVHEIFGEPK